MRYLHLYGAAALMMIAASCASTGHRSTTVDIGPVEKGAIGQISGQAAEVTIVDASGDTVVHHIVNIEMDSFDRRQLNYAYERGPIGQPVAWVNPDTGNNYQVISQSVSKDDLGRICRQSELVVQIGGTHESFNLIACRNLEGGWVLQK